MITANEQIRLHRHDEVADILRLVVFLKVIAHVAAERRAGNHAAHHIHQHCQRRPLRPADRLHRATIERDIRIGGLTSLGVERITERDALAAPRRTPDFPARGDRRRHIQIKWRFLARRCRHRDRAGAEQADTAAPGRHRL
jgi:hypothetical protein